MAQRVQTILTDDITGKEIAAGEGETISFAVDGTTYEIDLDTKSAKKFHETLAFYIDHGRKVGRITAQTRTKRTKTDADPATIRAWAAANGIQVNPRGRISAEVVGQFKAAGN